MGRSRFAPPAIAAAQRQGTRLEPHRRSGQFRPLQLGSGSASSAADADAGPPPPTPEQQRLALAQEARREGYAKGLEEGRTQAEAQIQQYLSRLGDAIEELARARTTVTEARRREMVELALAAAEALVQRELAQSETTLTHLIDTGLETLGRAEPLSLHVHPDDVARVEPTVQRAAAAGFEVQLLEDRQLEPGDLRIHGAQGTVESVLHDRVARIRQLVLGELDAGDSQAPHEEGESS